ncbi:hypothetical protein F5X99DRAFT_47445 [Biscogniauxia marginata]|nr:hypothetical protein F5X99DRAFT_47445 [Biscogniauxia marginata]
MATCSVEGNADMYGVGIRLGFYLNWFAGILANVIAAEEIETSRYAFSCFIAATFIALVVQTAQGTLTTLDMYIVLLLCFGYFFFLIPTFLWRLFTCFDVTLDPTRWPRARAGAFYHVVHGLLLLAVAAFQLWFWIVEASTTSECSYYGFLFARLEISATALRDTNIAFQALIVLICAGILVAQIIGTFSLREQPTIQIPERRKTLLRTIYAILLFTVASIVTAATELTIAWNKVTGVNTLDSAGQLIPFLVGLGIMGRVLYLGVLREKKNDGAAVSDHQPVNATYMPLPMAPRPPSPPAGPMTFPTHSMPYYRPPSPAPLPVNTNTLDVQIPYDSGYPRPYEPPQPDGDPLFSRWDRDAWMRLQSQSNSRTE